MRLHCSLGTWWKHYPGLPGHMGNRWWWHDKTGAELDSRNELQEGTREEFLALGSFA